MKITELKTFIVGNPWKNWLFLKICTDEGLTGIGEATSGFSTKPVEAQVQELSPLVLGEDPLHPERLWQKVFKNIYLKVNTALSAIEIACWDIVGKNFGVPLWQLLGGKTRPRLRVYANGWYTCPRDPGAFAQHALKVKEMGYTALKFDPFGTAYREIGTPELKLGVRILSAVRDAVGDNMDILIEAHDRFNVATAIQIGKQIEEFKPMWLEAPVLSTDIEGTLAVARAIQVPVAVGERFQRLSQFLDVMKSREISIVQPEVLNIGGISATRKAAAIAESGEALVALHQAQSPFNTAINAHINASIPNFLIQENFDDFLEPWTHDIFDGVPKVKDGCIEPSDKPGIGVELNEKEILKHPYGPNNYLRLFEEGWERRRREL